MNGQLNLPQPSINPQVVPLGQPVQYPDLASFFLQGFLNAQEAADRQAARKRLESQYARADHEVRSLDKKAEAEDASTIQNFLTALQDPALAEVLAPALSGLGNANIPSNMAMGGINAVAAPQVMGDKVQPSKIDQKKAQIAQEKALADMQRLTKGLLSPDQESGLNAILAAVKGGAPKEMVDALSEVFMPKQMLELARGEQELKAIKDAAKADEFATAGLRKLGVLPAGEGTVPGASKLYSDYISAVRADQRQAAMTREGKLGEALAGEALSVAFSMPLGTSPTKIAEQLKALHPNTPPGLVMKAAGEGLTAANKLRTPASDYESKTRQHFALMQVAVPNIDRLEAQGVRLTGKSLRTQQEIKLPLVGELPFVGDIVRGAARKALSPDERLLLNQLQIFGTAVLRKDSGATLTDKEERAVLEEYFPLSTDDPATIAQKKRNRAARWREMAAQSNHDPNDYPQTPRIPESTPARGRVTPTTSLRPRLRAR